MSMIMELLATITDAERQLGDKAAMLSHYLEDVDNFSKMADDLLSGSSSGIDQKVIDTASRTKTQIEDTIEKLQIAKSKIEQLETI